MTTRSDGPGESAGSESPADLDPAGDVLWRAVLDGWTDPARHDRFVGHCHATTRLVAAAARYRTVLDRDPRDELARKMSARVAFLAAQVLRPTAERRAPLWRSPVFLAIIALAAVAGALLGLFYRGGR
jgi:hypothetical protein